eukprot:CAMPEP_0115859374 /NCGR_PEP_ID=MMETSP0287-20121206/16583_1 /TAXON_ID=412157 /ORGANISM="Chrysochromulina rotalis, Strain UIO044" /LENGTH=135 /DNA_ID=CAMNT_0003313673 /DNA_START=12 /DNA_END=419 /DNA_ORIENTATION=+
MPGKKKGQTPQASPRDAPAAAAAAEPADGEAEEDEEEVMGNKRDGADISKVTDFVEQKELDSAKASKAIASITQEMEVDREAERARERELAAVAIEQGDVDLIATEMELDKTVAERKLREHKGDVLATLNTLVAA